MFCSREYTNYSVIQQTEKCKQIYIRPIWDGSSVLLRDWEKLQIRDSDYRNHQIFTLRCIIKVITQVSIRLKTTVRIEKARKIIRKEERDLLQAMVKSIISLLQNNAKQRDLCRSQLASIISTTSMLECQEFIDKVREFRYLKVWERQISKFDRLLQRKEI